MLFPFQKDNALNITAALKTAGYINALIELYLIDIMQSL